MPWSNSSAKRVAHVRRVCESKTPRLGNRLGDSYSRTAHYADAAGRRLEIERRSIDALAVHGMRDPQSLPEPARSRTQFSRIPLPPPIAPPRNAFGRLQGPNQDSRTVARFAANEIQTPMDSVGQVHVRAAGRPEHHGIARRRAGKTVRCRVLAIIGLGLDNDSAHSVDEQGHPYQAASDLRGIAREIDAFQSRRA